MTRKSGRRSSPEADARSHARRQAELVLGQMIGMGALQPYVVLQAHTDALLTHVFSEVNVSAEVVDQVVLALAHLLVHTPPVARAVVVCPGWFRRRGLLVKGLLTVEHAWRDWSDHCTVRWLDDEELLGDEEVWEGPCALRRPLPPPRDRYA